MPDLTTKGVPYANPADPNDLTLHTQGLADWIDAHPGVSPLTTAQRDALTGGALWDGRVIFNLTTTQLERYDAGAAVWRSGSVSDHGALSGLADDDHPQYLTTTRHDTDTRHSSYARKDGATFTGDVVLAARTTIGDADADVLEQRSVAVETHARSVTNGYTGDQLTSVTEKDGATTVRTTTLAYTGDQLTTITETAGGKTITTTLTYDGAGTLTGMTRSVA